MSEVRICTDAVYEKLRFRSCWGPSPQYIDGPQELLKVLNSVSEPQANEVPFYIYRNLPQGAD